MSKFFKKDIPSDGGMFIKLRDGESVEGIFRGEPHEFYSVFGDKERTEYPDYVKGSSYKFKINFIVREEGKPVAKIYQGGVTVRRRLEYLFEEFGQDCVYKIARKGSGKDDTEYFLDKKADLNPDQVANIDKLDLCQLTAKGEDKYAYAPPEDDSDLPF
jgi:hypothetical protein